MALNYEVIHGLDFTSEEIDESLKRGGLLSLELEFSRECNIRCVYCYASAGEAMPDELSVDELKDTIAQAAELGAKKIILIGGGEPLMYSGLREVVKYIYSMGLEQTIFTNGVLITRELADFFKAHRLSVVVKCNSQDQRIQDSLVGVEGTHAKIQSAIKCLMDAGYPDKELQLGIQTVIMKQNIDEIPSMWIWAKERGIIPYFEMLTIQGRAREYMEYAVEPAEVERIFCELRDIDLKKFDKIWPSRPTIASFSCKRHLYSCLINSQGYLQPCTGINLFVGNIREQSLKDILKSSKVITDLRGIRHNIEGECSSCDYSLDCYGCRGNAYQLTGNYLASDPACWLNNEDGYVKTDPKAALRHEDTSD